MDWDDHLDIVLTILVLNVLLALIFFAAGLFQGKGRRGTTLWFSVLTFFCPVAVPVYLGSRWLIEEFLKNQTIDMATISFDKKREDILLPPDAATEMNYVSIQDAVVLSDKPSVRRLLIDVLKHNSSQTLKAIAFAMNSPDTETSHYAAAAIQDALSEFRTTAQKMIEQMNRYPEDVEINLAALQYLHSGLELRIMTEIEQRSYVDLETDVAENLFRNNVWFMTAAHYRMLIDDLISVQETDRAAEWGRRACSYRRDELDTYKARLKLYYAQNRKEEFFDCLNEFRASRINADQEMLEIIRVYNGREEAVSHENSKK
ncbi:MAG: hypothetical protein QM296_02330 [Bacillota bacterium]|jgi:hypothetical protein|nr:hypothetical protein [Bacillota bacterium]